MTIGFILEKLWTDSIRRFLGHDFGDFLPFTSSDARPVSLVKKRIAGQAMNPMEVSSLNNLITALADVTTAVLTINEVAGL